MFRRRKEQENDSHEREISFWKTEMEKVVQEKNNWLQKYLRTSEDNEMQRAELFLAQREVHAARAQLEVARKQSECRAATSPSPSAVVGSSSATPRSPAPPPPHAEAATAFPRPSAGAGLASSVSSTTPNRTAVPSQPCPSNRSKAALEEQIVDLKRELNRVQRQLEAAEAAAHQSDMRVALLEERLAEAKQHLEGARLHTERLRVAAEEHAEAEAEAQRAAHRAGQLEKRLAEAAREVEAARRQTEFMRTTAEAHQREADALRAEVLSQRSINDETANETTKILCELSSAQQRCAKLASELSLKEQMISLLQLQLGDLAAVAAAGVGGAAGALTATTVAVAAAAAAAATVAPPPSNGSLSLSYSGLARVPAGLVGMGGATALFTSVSVGSSTAAAVVAAGDEEGGRGWGQEADGQERQVAAGAGAGDTKSDVIGGNSESLTSGWPATGGMESQEVGTKVNLSPELAAVGTTHPVSGPRHLPATNGGPTAHCLWTSAASISSSSSSQGGAPSPKDADAPTAGAPTTTTANTAVAEVTNAGCTDIDTPRAQPAAGSWEGYQTQDGKEEARGEKDEAAVVEMGRAFQEAGMQVELSPPPQAPGTLRMNLSKGFAAAAAAAASVSGTSSSLAPKATPMLPHPQPPAPHSTAAKPAAPSFTGTLNLSTGSGSVANTRRPAHTHTHLHRHFQQQRTSAASTPVPQLLLGVVARRPVKGSSGTGSNNSCSSIKNSRDRSSSGGSVSGGGGGDGSTIVTGKRGSAEQSYGYAGEGPAAKKATTTNMSSGGGVSSGTELSAGTGAAAVDRLSSGAGAGGPSTANDDGVIEGSGKAAAATSAALSAGFLSAVGDTPASVTPSGRVSDTESRHQGVEGGGGAAGGGGANCPGGMPAGVRDEGIRSGEECEWAAQVTAMSGASPWSMRALGGRRPSVMLTLAAEDEDEQDDEGSGELQEVVKGVEAEELVRTAVPQMVRSVEATAAPAVVVMEEVTVAAAGGVQVEVPSSGAVAMKASEASMAGTCVASAPAETKDGKEEGDVSVNVGEVAAAVANDASAKVKSSATVAEVTAQTPSTTTGQLTTSFVENTTTAATARSDTENCFVADGPSSSGVQSTALPVVAAAASHEISAATVNGSEPKATEVTALHDGSSEEVIASGDATASIKTVASRIKTEGDVKQGVVEEACCGGTKEGDNANGNTREVTTGNGVPVTAAAEAVVTANGVDAVETRPSGIGADEDVAVTAPVEATATMAASPSSMVGIEQSTPTPNTAVDASRTVDEPSGDEQRQREDADVAPSEADVDAKLTRSTTPVRVEPSASRLPSLLPQLPQATQGTAIIPVSASSRIPGFAAFRTAAAGAVAAGAGITTTAAVDVVASANGNGATSSNKAAANGAATAVAVAGKGSSNSTAALLRKSSSGSLGSMTALATPEGGVGKSAAVSGTAWATSPPAPASSSASGVPNVVAAVRRSSSGGTAHAALPTIPTPAGGGSSIGMMPPLATGLRRQSSGGGATGGGGTPMASVTPTSTAGSAAAPVGRTPFSGVLNSNGIATALRRQSSGGIPGPATTSTALASGNGNGNDNAAAGLRRMSSSGGAAVPTANITAATAAPSNSDKNNNVEKQTASAAPIESTEEEQQQQLLPERASAQSATLTPPPPSSQQTSQQTPTSTSVRRATASTGVTSLLNRFNTVIGGGVGGGGGNAAATSGAAAAASGGNERSEAAAGAVMMAAPPPGSGAAVSRIPVGSKIAAMRNTYEKK